MEPSSDLPDDHELETKWKSLSLTHVEYPVGDQLGQVLAAASLIPLVIVVSFVVLVLFKRDLHTLSYFLGLLINESINYTLKTVIREERPGPKNRTVYLKYGMPSSHSQLMWFFSTYFLLFLFFRMHHNDKQRLLENLWKACVATITVCTSVAVAYSRIYLQYHTVQQVLWGSVIGAFFGVSWFLFTQYVLTPLFPFVESWPVSKFFMLRDTTLIPNIMWFDYTSQRNESKSRQKKRSSIKREKSH